MAKKHKAKNVRKKGAGKTRLVKGAAKNPPPQKTMVNINKLLSMEEAIKYVVDLSGEKGLDVFKYLIYHGPMEENLLAKKLRFDKANAIRKFLYKLYSKNLVSYTKKKKGAKAWYTYYWKADPERLVFLLKKEYEDEIKQAKKSIDLNKATDFYICNTCNRRYGLMEALENSFRCSNCNDVLSHLDTSQVVGDKESRIAFLNSKIKHVSELVTIKRR